VIRNLAKKQMRRHFGGNCLGCHLLQRKKQCLKRNLPGRQPLRKGEASVEGHGCRKEFLKSRRAGNGNPGTGQLQTWTVQKWMKTLTQFYWVPLTPGNAEYTVKGISFIATGERVPTASTVQSSEAASVDPQKRTLTAEDIRIPLGVERIRCPEILMQPTIIGVGQVGVGEMV
jgi:hypothetical protein